jgi:signal recognition particle subunit SRP72
MAELGALNSLLRSSSIEDHDEALRLADAAIKSSGPGDDLTAHHTKVVALLKLDRFDDALRAIAAAGTRLEHQCLLEKAYALYKTGQLSEAEAVVSRAHKSRGARHVAAQIAYRAEKFDHAASTYRELLDAADEGMLGEENDLRINLLAADAQLEWIGDGHLVPQNEKQPGREEMEAFETAYNAACGCLARGDFAKAAMLLKRSRDLCEASEDLADEEKRSELVPIIVQQAYVATKLGKLDDAAALQKAVALDEYVCLRIRLRGRLLTVIDRVSDAATKAVAQNNALVLQPQRNPYITQKVVQTVPKIAGNDRLFEYQSTVLRRNKYIIELQCQKFTGVQKTTGHIIAGEASSPVTTDKAVLGVIHAAAKAELQTGKEALRSILPMLDSRPDDVGLLLTIIQLYIQTEQPGKALALLEAFFKRLEAATTPDRADIRFAPGLVALAVSLYRLQGRQTAIRAELARAAAHWENSLSSDTTSSRSDSLLREAGIALLHSSNSSDLSISGAAFSRLAAAAPEDRAARAGLVASFAVSDPEKASAHLDALSPVDKLISGVDVSSLLEGGVASLPTPPSSAAGKKRGASAPQSEDSAAPAAKKAKADAEAQAPKKRRGKLPKDYDPSKKPDPERWLPLRDRSTYRPKGKKGKKRAAEATQGGPVKEEETLELVGGAGAVKVEKAGGGGGGGANKKKKKGKK